jgi:hypothetical protein
MRCRTASVLGEAPAAVRGTFNVRFVLRKLKEQGQPCWLLLLLLDCIRAFDRVPRELNCGPSAPPPNTPIGLEDAGAAPQHRR